MVGQIPNPLETVWHDLGGQADIMTQIAAFLFAASVVLLLLSLVTFQVSRMMQRETRAGYHAKGDKVAIDPDTNMPTSLAEREGVPPTVDFDITASRAMDADQAKQPGGPRHVAASARTTGEPVMPQGPVITDGPENITYLTPDRIQKHGRRATEMPEAASIPRKDLHETSSPRQKGSADAPVPDDMDIENGDLEGFIFKQRRRKPASVPDSSHSDDGQLRAEKPTPAATSAATSDHGQVSDPADALPDETLLELGRIEGRMQLLKEFYKAGHISREVYAEESRELFAQARKLIDGP